MTPSRSVCVLTVAFVTYALPARASPIETFGFLPSDQARAGAAVASGEVASAAVTNPAAAALGSTSEVALAWQYQHLGLTLEGAPANLMDVHGGAVALGVPFTFGPLHLGLSAAAYIPDQFLAQIQLLPETQPQFVMFQNRVHRTVVNGAVAIALTRTVSLGIGATIFADAAGNGVDFQVGAAPGRTIAQGSLDVSLPLRAAPVVGVLIHAAPWITVGVRASGALDLSLALDVKANASIPGTSANGDAVVSIRGTDYYTPAEVAGGVRITPDARWRVDAELAWRHWSAAPPPATDVALLINIGVAPSTVMTALGPAGFRDIVVPRVAAEWDLPTSRGPVTLRAGYAYVPTPVPAQTGVTAWADGDRHVVSTGASIPLGRALGAAWRVEVALGWQHMVPFSAVRADPLTPGGAISGSGEILGGSTALRIAW